MASQPLRTMVMRRSTRTPESLPLPLRKLIEALALFWSKHGPNLGIEQGFLLL